MKRHNNKPPFYMILRINQSSVLQTKVITDPPTLLSKGLVAHPVVINEVSALQKNLSIKVSEAITFF